MAKKTKPKSRSEQEFLANYDASLYPHPSLSVDVALITIAAGKLKGLLIRRDRHPERGKWALPGTFVGIHESLDDAANRALNSKTGVSGIFLEQLFSFGDPDRDPRTRVVTVAYYALVDPDKLSRSFDADAQSGLIELTVPWEGESGGPVGARDENGKPAAIAFDHADILGLAVQRMRGKLDYAPIGFELLPKRFTLRQLQNIHETIQGRRLNKDSFRRRMIASGLIAPTGELEQSVGHRPAELYRFKRKRK
jgi:8-oxo-dGTP diphosphatase